MPPGAGPVWVETEVIEVCRPDRPEEPYLRPHVVVLRERDGTRRLPMFTGPAEAIALACSLGAGDLPRPRAYQLAADLLAAAGSRLTEVRDRKSTRLNSSHVEISYAVFCLKKKKKKTKRQQT